MSHISDLTSRENEVVRILGVLGRHAEKFVVIGGYAVNALTSHRFSVDCDLVIDARDLRFFEVLLVREKYKADKSAGARSLYGTKMHKFVKPVGGKTVSVEIFVSGVKCRQTDGIWDYNVIKKNSASSNIVGLTDSVKAHVPARELLMAMKIHAGRGTDLRDVVMLGERANWNLVSKYAKTGDMEKLRGQIKKSLTKLNEKNFPSSLKAGFGLRIDIASLVSGTTKGLGHLLSTLSE